MVVATFSREVFVRDLFNHEEGPNAANDDQVGLHVFLTVRVPTMASMVAMPMVVTMSTAEVWDRVEKDVTEEAPHGEGQEDVGEALARLPIPEHCHVH